MLICALEFRMQQNLMRGSRGGGTGGPDSPEYLQNIGFLSNTGPDPPKKHKVPSQNSMLGHHRPASETRFAGGPMIVHLKWYLDPSSPHQLNKKLSKLDPLRQNYESGYL